MSSGVFKLSLWNALTGSKESYGMHIHNNGFLVCS